MLLKCNDNQGHENVNEEEWKHYEINDVKYGHFNAKVLNWTPILVSGGHRMLKNSKKRHKMLNSLESKRNHLTVAILRLFVQRIM